MHSALVQEQARAQLKAALLGLMAAFHDDGGASPQIVACEFRFNQHGQEGEYSFWYDHKGRDVPLSGGSL